MNLRFWVWLPPDGDVRLVRFQQSVANALGHGGLALVPPYLRLDVPGRFPVGPVRVGSWVIDGDPVLEALDDEGSLGRFRFNLPVPKEPSAILERCPPAPGWSWTRGRTAWLVLDGCEDGSFALWSWESLSGWKQPLPRG